MQTSTIFIVISVIAFIMGLGIIIFGFQSLKKRKILQRLQDFVIDQESRMNFSPSTNPDTTMRELEGSIIKRTIIPMLRKLVNFFYKFTPDSISRELNRKLSVAGNPYGIRAREFITLRIIVILVGFLCAIILLSMNEEYTFRSIAVALLILLCSLILPELILNQMVRKAQNKIRRGLPDALDMLSVCATAGLGFDQSLQKVSDAWKTPLGFEFRKVVQEMEVGLSRTEALRNMSHRLDVKELSSFVAVLVQAEQLGMQIADILHSQAEQMRILRQFRAKEIANRLPAKMMVPLALCILPALIGVILGPMLPEFMKALGSI